jgi:hypothetical protein
VEAQRFFRAGFSGGLGRDFPVELFAGLHDVLTAGNTPAPARTPRWNVRPGLLEAQLDQGIAKARTKLKEAKGEAGPWSEKLTAALDNLSKKLEEFKEHRKSTFDSLAKTEATAVGDTVTVSRRRDALQKIWDEFQGWDRTWEESITTAVEVLKKLSGEIGKEEDLFKTPDVERCLAVLNGPPNVADIADEIAGAITMRRALNVAEDDRAQYLDDESGSARTVATIPVRPTTIRPPAATPPPAVPPR